MPATYEPIATTTFGSAAANYTFSSIPSTYTDLKLVVATSPANGALSYFRIELNGDTTSSNYSAIRLYGDGANAGSVPLSGVNGSRVGIVGASSTIPSLNIFNFFSYAGSTYKTYLTESASDTNGSGQVNRFVSLWRSTSAINAIKIYFDSGTNLIAGSTLTLYGIKAA